VCRGGKRIGEGTGLMPNAEHDTRQQQNNQEGRHNEKRKQNRGPCCRSVHAFVRCRFQGRASVGRLGARSMGRWLRNDRHNKRADSVFWTARRRGGRVAQEMTANGGHLAQADNKGEEVSK